MFFLLFIASSAKMNLFNSCHIYASQMFIEMNVKLHESPTKKQLFESVFDMSSQLQGPPYKNISLFWGVGVIQI